MVLDFPVTLANDTIVMYVLSPFLAVYAVLTHLRQGVDFFQRRSGRCGDWIQNRARRVGLLLPRLRARRLGRRLPHRQQLVRSLQDLAARTFLLIPAHPFTV
jgi:hypothetical protein